MTLVSQNVRAGYGIPNTGCMRGRFHAVPGRGTLRVVISTDLCDGSTLRQRLTQTNDTNTPDKTLVMSNKRL